MDYTGWPWLEARSALTRAGHIISKQEFTGPPCPPGQEAECRVVRQRAAGTGQVELVLVWRKIPLAEGGG